MNLIDMLGSTVTTDKGRVVKIEDTYPKGRLCGKDQQGNFVVITPGLVEENIPRFGDVIKSHVTLVTEGKSKTNEESKSELLVYVTETICGGDNAVGGGCGAALNVSRTYQTEASPSLFNYTDFQEHNDSEVVPALKDARNKGHMRLRLVFRPCSSCYERV